MPASDPIIVYADRTLPVGFARICRSDRSGSTTETLQRWGEGALLTRDRRVVWFAMHPDSLPLLGDHLKPLKAAS